MKLCERFECENYFKPKVSYQIYCSNTCRELATKEKIAERYQQTRKQKRKNKVRNCRNCGEKLSMYSDDILCFFCNIDPKLVNKALKELKKLGVIDYEQDAK